MKKRVRQPKNIIDIQIPISEMSEERVEYIEKSMAIANYISNFIKSNDYKQKDLADKLGKTEAEVSKWMSGLHNLTLKSIIKLESVLPIHILNPEITGVATQCFTYMGSINIPSNEIPSHNYIDKYGLNVGSYVEAIGRLSNQNNTTTKSISGKIRA